MARAALLLACLIGLGGCEVMTIGFVGANMATLMHTDKTIPDIILSDKRGKNCSLLHVAKNQPYCKPEPPDPALALRELADNRYCYRTLGRIDCYERPDFLASGHTRVNFATGFPPPNREPAAMAHRQTKGSPMAGIPAPAAPTPVTGKEPNKTPADKSAKGTPASLMAPDRPRPDMAPQPIAGGPGMLGTPMAQVPPLGKLPGQGTY